MLWRNSVVHRELPKRAVGWCKTEKSPLCELPFWAVLLNVKISRRNRVCPIQLFLRDCPRAIIEVVPRDNSRPRFFKRKAWAFFNEACLSAHEKWSRASPYEAHLRCMKRFSVRFASRWRSHRFMFALANASCEHSECFIYTWKITRN